MRKKIARDWNVRDSGYGAVTEFDVDASFLANYEVHEARGVETANRCRSR
jgi:hypothetical protein